MTSAISVGLPLDTWSIREEMEDDTHVCSIVRSDISTRKQVKYRFSDGIYEFDLTAENCHKTGFTRTCSLLRPLYERSGGVPLMSLLSGFDQNFRCKVSHYLSPRQKRLNGIQKYKFSKVILIVSTTVYFRSSECAFCQVFSRNCFHSSPTCATHRFRKVSYQSANDMPSLHLVWRRLIWILAT